MTIPDPSRRRFLRLTALGGGATFVAARRGPSLAARARRAGERADAIVDGPAAAPDGASVVAAQDEILELAMAAVVDRAQLRPGEPTTVWRYQASVTAGDPARLQAVDGPFPGPIIRVRQGMRLRVAFTNHLREDTTVHWHGLNVPAAMDGHPSAAVAPGAAYAYDFEVRNPPGTYWFHPHPHGRTGAQVYRGLAGLLIVDEAPDDPRLAALPAGLRDLPLIVQDRTLDDVNALVYTQSVMGFLGDDIFVNGRERAVVDVERAAYRVRVLNGSNHRILKLGWRDGGRVTVVGTDGGLLDAPALRPYVMLGPGERIELLADLRALPPGAERALDSLAFRDDSMAMGARLPQGAAAQVVTLRVRGAPSPGGGRAWLPIGFVGRGGGRAGVVGRGEDRPAGAVDDRLAADRPAAARPSAAHRADTIPADRTIALRLQNGIFTLNGRTYDMDAVADDEIVRLGAEEVWAFVNEGAQAGMGMGMMMAGAHVMHVHLVRFRVVERGHDGRFAAAYATVADGLVDEGWKDTVLVMPGETVKVRATFGDFTGTYLYHCHMLEHEDQGMMRNFRVDP